MIASALAVVCAMFLIVGGDAAGKLASNMGFAPIFVAWARFSVAAAVLLPFVGLHRSELRLFMDWRLILRAALIVGGISSILTALKTTPMADAFGAFFVGPIVSYALSAILLREKTSIVRSVLLGFSFVGLLLVVRPGFGMTPGLGFALLAGCFHGAYLVATRWLAGSYRPRFLLYSQLVVGSVLLSPTLLIEIPTMDAQIVRLLVYSALGSAAGNMILVLVNRTTPATIIAPLIYTQIFAATFFGWWQFNELPDTLGVIGLMIVVLAGAGSVIFASRRG